MKISDLSSKTFQFLLVKFLIYLNGRIFVKILLILLQVINMNRNLLSPTEYQLHLYLFSLLNMAGELDLKLDIKTVERHCEFFNDLLILYQVTI